MFFDSEQYIFRFQSIIVFWARPGSIEKFCSMKIALTFITSFLYCFCCLYWHDIICILPCLLFPLYFVNVSSNCMPINACKHPVFPSGLARDRMQQVSIFIDQTRSFSQCPFVVVTRGNDAGILEMEMSMVGEISGVSFYIWYGDNVYLVPALMKGVERRVW